MNWLAHLILSDPTPASRIGGLLPDLVSAAELDGISPIFNAGIQRHRQIDAFTDSHPVFRRSVARFEPPFRRFGGVIVDVFYDHFIARDWHLYSDIPLRAFTAEFYTSFEAHRPSLPPLAYERLLQIKAGGWLDSYGEFVGIEEALRRLSFRLKRHFDLAASISILKRDHDAFGADFSEFFADLVAQLLPGGQLPGKECGADF